MPSRKGKKDKNNPPDPSKKKPAPKKPETRTQPEPDTSSEGSTYSNITTTSERSTQGSTVERLDTSNTSSRAPNRPCGQGAVYRDPALIRNAGPPLAHFPEKKKKVFSYPNFLARTTRKSTIESTIKEAMKSHLLENQDVEFFHRPMRQVSVRERYCRRVVHDFKKYCKDTANSVLQVWTFGKDRSKGFAPLESEDPRHIRSMEEFQSNEDSDEEPINLDQSLDLTLSLPTEQEKPEVFNLRHSLQSLAVIDQEPEEEQVEKEAGDSAKPTYAREIKNFERQRGDRLVNLRLRIRKFRSSFRRKRDELKKQEIKSHFPELVLPINRPVDPPETPEAEKKNSKKPSEGQEDKNSSDSK